MQLWYLQIFQGIHKLKQGGQSASVLHDLAVDFVENAGHLEAHLKYAKLLFAASFPERLMQMLQVRIMLDLCLLLYGTSTTIMHACTEASVRSVFKKNAACSHHLCKVLATLPKDWQAGLQYGPFQALQSAWASIKHCAQKALHLSCN